jgi:L-malate glycosyltransferase
VLAPVVDGLPAGVDWVGGGVLVSELALGLVAAGHDVHVATLGVDVEEDRVVPGDGLTVHVGHYRRRGRARDLFRSERAAVSRAVRRVAPDVAHAHWTYEYALGALATGVPTVVTVHDWAPTILRFDPQPYRFMRLAMAVRALARADALTAPSPYLARLVRRWTRRACEVVPNAVPDRDIVDDLGPWPRSSDGPVLVSVNVGWGTRKNVAALLDAMPRLLDAQPGARLRLLGPGYGPEGPAAAHAASLGLPPGALEFVGPVTHDEVLVAMAGADVLVHPAREESFGMVLAEAMGVGTPVVAGRHSGATAWVCGDGGAMLVDVTDPSALAAGILEAVTDVAATERRRRTALERVRGTFALSRAVERHLAVYDDVLRGAST